ncbi:MAG: hypothetical protein R3B45_07030 [Bdellovibrionota bacterium]
MNLVFHIVAVLCLVGILWLLHRTQMQRDFLRKIIKNIRQKKLAEEYNDKISHLTIKVDWPLKYLSRFCQTLEIPFDSELELGSIAPVKIKEGSLFDFYLYQGIVSIAVRREERERVDSSARSKEPVVYITTGVENGCINDRDGKNLSEALGLKVELNSRASLKHSLGV